MAYEMYDYLSAVVADYDYTLDTRPRQEGSGAIGIYRNVKEVGARSQVIHTADDESEQRIGLATGVVFTVSIDWNGLSADHAGTVFDLYFDSSKANCKLNSFRWRHPTDGHVYVVRFDMDLERGVHSLTEVHRLPSIKLKVLGRIND